MGEGTGAMAKWNGDKGERTRAMGEGTGAIGEGTGAMAEWNGAQGERTVTAVDWTGAMGEWNEVALE